MNSGEPNPWLPCVCSGCEWGVKQAFGSTAGPEGNLLKQMGSFSNDAFQILQTLFAYFKRA